MSKKYTNLGTVMKAKKNQESDPDRFYIRLEQQKDKDKKPVGEQIFPITLANGKVIHDGQTLAMFSKREKFDKLVKDDKMTREKADQLSSFLRYDVVLVEDVNEGGGESDPSSDSGINF